MVQPASQSARGGKGRHSKVSQCNSSSSNGSSSSSSSNSSSSDSSSLSVSFTQESSCSLTSKYTFYYYLHNITTPYTCTLSSNQSPILSILQVRGDKVWLVSCNTTISNFLLRSLTSNVYLQTLGKVGRGWGRGGAPLYVGRQEGQDRYWVKSIIIVIVIIIIIIDVCYQSSQYT